MLSWGKGRRQKMGGEGEGKETLRVHEPKHLLHLGICLCHTSSGSLVR